MYTVLYVNYISIKLNKKKKKTKQASKNKELGKNRKFQSNDDTLVRKTLHLNQK